ncbi:DNA-formamidopyrimidine glycosylase [Ureaplasma ceti]|uniref:DNA-formamidopyrimidine glycosylase n=1 Tax=Ureaplasma ceti TaxID=3119530 RepID=A0ABP9U6Y8_9BACT
MPELPEVQTVITYLSKKVPGHKITKIDMHYPKLLKNATVSQFQEFMVGETFTSISRKGKFLIFHLTNNKTFVVHLRMEGKLFVQAIGSEPSLKQLCAEIYLDDCVLRYYDTRKFGTFEILNNSDPELLPSVHKLAIDAIDEEFTGEFLFNKIHKSTKKIKTILLDQAVVAGLGNIYVNEVLFAARIHPERLGKDVSLEECNAIAAHSKVILQNAIAHNGTTIHSFKVNELSTGGYQEFLQIHGRAKQPCKVCDTTIEFKKVNGRGTHFCPKCQK